MNLLFIAMMVLLAIAVGALIFGFVVYGIAKDQSFVCNPDSWTCNFGDKIK